MVLIRNITIICIGLMLFMHMSRRTLKHHNPLSGTTSVYSKGLTIAVGCVLTFAAAFREGFVDTGVYESMYRAIGTDWNNAFNQTIPIEDYGFSLFMVLLNRISSDSRLLVVVTSVLTIVPFIYVIWKYSQNVPMSIYLFFVISYFTTMNGIRQIMAAALFSLALPWIRDRKFIPYALLVLLLSTFHASMIVMLPLYFVIAGPRMNKGIWLFLLAIVGCFAAPSAANRLMGSLLEDSVYEDYLSNEAKMGMMRFLVTLIPTVLTLLYCWICKAGNTAGHDDKVTRLIDILINMQIVSFGFTALGMQMVYFARVSMYFTVVLPLLLPIVIRGTFTKRSAEVVNLISLAMYTFYHYYQIISYDSYGYLNGFRLKF